MKNPPSLDQLIAAVRALEGSAQAARWFPGIVAGDTVAALLSRLGVNDEAGLAFLRADPVGRQIFRQLIPGRTLSTVSRRSPPLRRLHRRWELKDGNESVFPPPFKAHPPRRDGRD